MGKLTEKFWKSVRTHLQVHSLVSEANRMNADQRALIERVDTLTIAVGDLRVQLDMDAMVDLDEVHGRRIFHGDPTGL